MNFILTRRGLAFVGLVCLPGGAAMAAAPDGGGATTHCPCDSAAAPTAATAKHAINTKGTGGTRVAEPAVVPLQQVAPAASSAGGTTKRPGHVTINR